MNTVWRSTSASSICSWRVSVPCLWSAHDGYTRGNLCEGVSTGHKGQPSSVDSDSNFVIGSMRQGLVHKGRCCLLATQWLFHTMLSSKWTSVSSTATFSALRIHRRWTANIAWWEHHKSRFRIPVGIRISHNLPAGSWIWLESVNRLTSPSTMTQTVTFRKRPSTRRYSEECSHRSYVITNRL